MLYVNLVALQKYCLGRKTRFCCPDYKKPTNIVLVFIKVPNKYKRNSKSFLLATTLVFGSRSHVKTALYLVNLLTFFSSC